MFTEPLLTEIRFNIIFSFIFLCFANEAGLEINSHILAIKTLKFITFKQLYLPVVVFR